jgi:hypothetical protein
MLSFNIFSTRERVATLCQTCIYRHVIEGVAGDRLTSCTFGYSVRPIKFGVSDCSGYTDARKIRPLTVIQGFVIPPE